MKRSWSFGFGLCLVVVAAFGPLGAEESKPLKSAVFGTSQSQDGYMLRREAADKAWQIVKKGDELHGGETVLGLSGAVILSKNQAVQLTLRSDLNARSPYPIIESAVTLPVKPAAVDLDVTLDRGRVDLVNLREKGAARVRVMVHGEPWDLTLETPRSRVALETFGRWPRGVPFTINPGPKDVPQFNLILVVLAGEVTVKVDKVYFGMSAPPGPAILQWDSVYGVDTSPQKLEKLPEWAIEGKLTPKAEKIEALRQKFREAITTRPMSEVLDEFVNSEDPLERRWAVLSMGALDDLPRLAAALRSGKHGDVWDNAVRALRHWIGRCPGQDLKLYHRMVDGKKVTPTEAETILSLLHSFGEDDLARRETYELLVAYLDHDQLGVRGLAYWHLSRLYPDGKDFGYDPLAPKDQRDKAIQKWKGLLTNGTLPPKSKKDK